MDYANKLQKNQIFENIYNVCYDEDNTHSIFRLCEMYDDMENQILAHSNYDMDEPQCPCSPIQSLLMDFHNYCVSKNPVFKLIDPMSNLK